jgi:hypothetical protein
VTNSTRFAAAALAALALCSRASAQATEGTILGALTDPSGASVTSAKVSVTSLETGVVRSSVSGQSGEYLVSNLPPGHYSVGVEASGFKKAFEPGVELTVKARVRVDMRLEVGDAAQSIEVVATALIRTDTPEVGGVVDRELLEDAPVFGRNFMTLSGLVAGTTDGPAASRQRDFSNSAITVGGAAPEANNFIVDGVSNNMEFSGAMGVTPAMDAIQEFAVQTSQYSAEFGRSGGGVVNVAIRSGTNQYHGFAYDYLRNDVFDAQAYDFTNLHPPKQPLRQNLFGAGIGMPVIKNRLFFFGNYEGKRSLTTTNSFTTVPTAAEKSGNFARNSFMVADPDAPLPGATPTAAARRTPFPGNIIPANRFDPSGVALLKLLPNPNYTDVNPSIINTYYVNQINTDDLDSYNAKGDARIDDKTFATARISQQFGVKNQSGWMPQEVLGGIADLNATNGGVTFTRILSQRMVNETRIGYNYLRFGNEMIYRNQVLNSTDVPGLNVASFATGYPSVTIRNYTAPSIVRPIASVPNPFYLVEHSFQLMNNLSFTRGRHGMKAGGEFNRLNSNRFQGRNGGAVLSYTGMYTTPTVGQSLEAARNGVPDVLLGLASSFLTQYAFDAVRIHSTRVSGFFQDDWRVSTNLTLNLGLRWDYFGPYHEEQDRFANFDVGTGTRLVPESARRVVRDVLGIPGGDLPSGWRYVPLDSVIPHKNLANFSPRFGFAWQPSRRIVLRGGVGIFYAATTANDFNNSGTEGNPFFFDYTLTGDISNPVVVRNGFPVGGLLNTLAQPTFAAYYGPLHRHDPYAEKWSFNVQAAPLRKTMVEIGYAGQDNRAFPALVPGNTPPPATGTIQTRRPYPNVGFFWQYVPVSDSNYHSLQITVRQREVHRFSLSAAFTYAKNLGYGGGTGTTLNDPYNLRYDYGLLPWDLRKRFVGTVIYRLPVLKGWNRWARGVLGGWQASSLINVHDGFPFTVGVSGPTLNNGAGTNRANMISDPNLPADQRTRDRWFNTKAFTAPPNFVWGNQGKNMLRAPALAQTDVGVSKRFPLTESVKVSLRGESQNVFNRVQLGTPISTFNTSGFGAIRSLAAGPRNVQVAARVEF